MNITGISNFQISAKPQVKLQRKQYVPSFSGLTKPIELTLGLALKSGKPEELLSAAKLFRYETDLVINSQTISFIDSWIKIAKEELPKKANDEKMHITIFDAVVLIADKCIEKNIFDKASEITDILSKNLLFEDEIVNLGVTGNHLIQKERFEDASKIFKSFEIIKKTGSENEIHTAYLYEGYMINQLSKFKDKGQETFTRFMVLSEYMTTHKMDNALIFQIGPNLIESNNLKYALGVEQRLFEMLKPVKDFQDQILINSLSNMAKAYKKMNKPEDTQRILDKLKSI